MLDESTWNRVNENLTDSDRFHWNQFIEELYLQADRLRDVCRVTGKGASEADLLVKEIAKIPRMKP